ncbi:HAD family hydrolase [Nigerium massiliense]|uniref:HAD family hydrolase n=1 Tax=Nigerium massiliense TaxID=1522317 RepID=UPI0006946E82|nr:HAD family phosphatase [Nigerium massiliense]
MTELPARVSAVIFDCDGVLVNTEPLWEEAEEELLARYGSALEPGDRAAVLGSPWDFSIRLLAQRAGVSDLDTFGDELREIAVAKLRHTRPLPGAVEVLTALHGRVPLGIGSNATVANLRLELEAAGLYDLADTVVSCEEVEHAKPAADVYLEVCRRLGADPATAIGVEDSANGALALRAAGIPVIAVPTIADQVIDHDWQIGSLEQIVDWAHTVQPLTDGAALS